MSKAKRASLSSVGLFKKTAAQEEHPLKTITSQQQNQAVELPIDDIRPDPNQPRKTFDVEGIASLAGSIVEKGLFQPIAVRPDPEREGSFILVMGERRWRAHQHVGIPSIRAFIIPVTDPDEAYELALIENIQREDLNPLEEAEGICQLMQRRGYNQREVAKTIGKSESQVSRLRKLTTLPDPIKEKLVRAQVSISQEHLFRIVEQKTPDDQLKLFNQITQLGLSRDQAREAAKGKTIERKEHPLIGKLKRIEKAITHARQNKEFASLEDQDRKTAAALLDAISTQISETIQEINSTPEG
jgi:ParB family chromosome partitioning protein